MFTNGSAMRLRGGDSARGRLDLNRDRSTTAAPDFSASSSISSNFQHWHYPIISTAAFDANAPSANGVVGTIAPVPVLTTVTDTVSKMRVLTLGSDNSG